MRLVRKLRYLGGVSSSSSLHNVCVFVWKLKKRLPFLWFPLRTSCAVGWRVHGPLLDSWAKAGAPLKRRVVVWRRPNFYLSLSRQIFICPSYAVLIGQIRKRLHVVFLTKQTHKTLRIKNAVHRGIRNTKDDVGFSTGFKDCWTGGGKQAIAPLGAQWSNISTSISMLIIRKTV